MAAMTFTARATKLEHAMILLKAMIALNQKAELVFDDLIADGDVTPEVSAQKILDAAGPVGTAGTLAYELNQDISVTGMWTYA